MNTHRKHYRISMVKVYEQIKEEFKKLIAERKKLSKEDLLAWCEKHSVGILTLCSIIEDLEKERIIKTTYGSETLLIDLPEYVETRDEEKIDRGEANNHQEEIFLIKSSRDIGEKRFRRQKSKKKQRRLKNKKVSSITKYLCEDSVSAESPVQESRDLEKTKVVEDEDYSDFFSKFEEADYRKALIYLSRFRSVGEIRFALDLKKEGVSDTLKIIRKMIEDGYATRSPLGVINATEKLPKIKAMFSLADLLS